MALHYYLTAFELDHETDNIHLFLAMAYYGEENYLPAKEHLQKAININTEALNLFLEIYPDALQYINLTT